MMEVGSFCRTTRTADRGVEKYFGEEYAAVVQQTADGGFIVTGKGNGEVLVLKTDERGNLLM